MHKLLSGIRFKMSYQLVQTEPHYTAEHHSWDNTTTNGKQRVRISNLFYGGVHGSRIQILGCICEHESLKLIKVT